MALKKYPAVSGLVASIILIYIASHAVQSTWSFYGMEKFHWSEKMVGISLGMVGFCVALVQGGLIRVVIPKLGQEKSVYTGLALYSVGMLLFAFASQGWMMFAFTAFYCLGGIAGPALQAIISGNVPRNEQGELQGALTSLMSATAVIGPLLMTNLFSTFTKKTAPIYLPGAPFIAGAILITISAVLAYRALHPGRAVAERVPANNEK
jgi:DHA1 family tetracycline resistance protein-like MFS transporter